MDDRQNEPVARLHITMGECYLEANVEVLDGESLQVKDSPVDVYVRPPETWTAKEIADACVKAGLGILECHALMITLRGVSGKA